MASANSPPCFNPPPATRQGETPAQLNPYATAETFQSAPPRPAGGDHHAAHGQTPSPEMFQSAPRHAAGGNPTSYGATFMMFSFQSAPRHAAGGNSLSSWLVCLQVQVSIRPPPRGRG